LKALHLSIDPATWLSILSGILSAGAFIIAFISLWFSQIKGPHIDLCKTPEVKVLDLSSQNWGNVVPFWFNLSPMQLIFSNSGSRGGVISSVFARFQPSKEFKPFFNDFRSSVELQCPAEGVAPRQLPVSILQGDNCIVKLSCTIEFLNWKEHLKTPQTTNITNIKEFFEESMKYNREQLADFLKFLQSKQSFGTITFYLESTRSEFLKTRLVESRLASSVEVRNTLKAMTIETFTACLKEWKSKLSYAEQELLQVPAMFDGCTQKLTQDMDLLNQEVKKERVYNLPTLQQELEYLASRAERGGPISQIVLRREIKIRNLLNSVNNDLMEFSNKASLIQATSPDTDEEQIELLEKTRLDLKPKVVQAIEVLHELHKRLSKEVLSSLNNSSK
jgi:hypothetical protein